MRCGRGRLLDVAVDIRVGSPTYGQWFAIELSFDNGRQLFIPEGFLHGFVTLEKDTEIIYKCSDYYDPQSELSVRFDDPQLNIDWLLDLSDMSGSEKDLSAPYLSQIESPFLFGA